MAYIYDIADVWASSGTTFTGIKLSVTDTASAAGSLLMDLQVGGVSKFSVSKAGTVTTAAGSAAAPGVSIGASPTGFFEPSSGTLAFASGANEAFRMEGVLGLGFRNSAFLWWTSGANGAYSNRDLVLARDAANTLAQRNGVNAQAFNLYNTYTDASNYERGFMKFASNTLRIGTEQLGTGTARAIEFYTDGVKRFEILANGNVQAPNFVAATSLFFGATGQITSGRIRLLSPADGQALFHNGASNGFDRIMLGGTTSSFPAIKRDTTSLQARLADDSAFTNIQGKLTTDTAYTAGAPTATGYIVLFDSTGAAYRVPAVAN